MSMRRRIRGRRETAELNITAFMNLMVVLVPFLLITAVFSRITILELNLPSANSAPAEQQQKQSLDLTVIVRQDQLQVFASNALLKSFPKENDNYAFGELNTLLKKVKQRQPDTLDARILLESDVPYEALVSTMDAVRVGIDDGTASELFPVISIGDAQPATRTAQ